VFKIFKIFKIYKGFKVFKVFKVLNVFKVLLRFPRYSNCSWFSKMFKGFKVLACEESPDRSVMRKTSRAPSLAGRNAFGFTTRSNRSLNAPVKSRSCAVSCEAALNLMRTL